MVTILACLDVYVLYGVTSRNKVRLREKSLWRLSIDGGSVRQVQFKGFIQFSRRRKKAKNAKQKNKKLQKK